MDIVDFYYLYRISYSCLNKQLNSLTQSCRNLREIALNYTYVFATSVVTMCENLQGSLQKIYLYVSFWEYSHMEELIPSKDWSLALELIPNLKVVVLMSYWCTDPTTFLDKAMPLIGMEIKGGQSRYSHQTYANKTTALLNHLTTHFANSLQFISLTAEGRSSKDQNFDRSLMSFLSSCKNLQKIVISDNLVSLDDSVAVSCLKKKIESGLDFKLMTKINNSTCSDKPLL